MRKVSLFVLTSIVATLLSTFGSIGPVAAGTPAGADNECWQFRTKERGFAKKINTARESVGMGKLSLDPELSKAARVHTRAMVKNNELYHTPTDKLTSRVRGWTILGENVGVGGTVTSLHTAFMASHGHYENIVHPEYRHVGIGTKEAHGRLWVTVIFEGENDPGTPLPMPKC